MGQNKACEVEKSLREGLAEDEIAENFFLRFEEGPVYKTPSNEHERFVNVLVQTKLNCHLLR